jgi:hypothetical protein
MERDTPPAAAVMMLVAAISLLIFIATKAWAQHPPEHQELHEKFYSTWMIPRPGMPDHRKASCCDKRDCYPAEVTRIGGQWFFLHRETKRWLPIPENRLEHNQPDPRESPDGRSHICAGTTGVLYCATLGAAI